MAHYYNLHRGYVSQGHTYGKMFFLGQEDNLSQNW